MNISKSRDDDNTANPDFISIQHKLCKAPQFFQPLNFENFISFVYQ